MKKILSVAVPIDDVRKIVREELISRMNESADDPMFDHKWLKDIVTAASRMLTTIEDFEKIISPHSGLPSTGPVVNAVGEPLKKLKDALTDMVMNPTSYLPEEKLDYEKPAPSLVSKDKEEKKDEFDADVDATKL